MNIKKALWLTLGFLSLGVAYVGLVTPGLPFSHFLVFAAYCFAKSSKKMHDWLYNHKHFGPFLTGWRDKRIFPTRAKYLMVVMMTSSLIISWFTVGSVELVVGLGFVMAVSAWWCWVKFPGSEAEWQAKQSA